MRMLMFAAIAAGMTVPGAAQDLNSQEVVVTANRIEQDDYSREMPAVGLRRPADFLVQRVVVRGDTRDQAQRRREIRTMLTDAVRRAAQAGVELAYGDYILTPLTAANVEDVELSSDNRPDSERAVFLVKAKLAGTQSGQAAEAQIKRYIDSVPEVGRAQLDEWDDSTLSIVGPDSYRPQIAEEISRDAATMAGKIGANYVVEIEGLNMPVQWSKSGPGEVMLYIPYSMRIVPKP